MERLNYLSSPNLIDRIKDFKRQEFKLSSESNHRYTEGETIIEAKGGRKWGKEESHAEGRSLRALDLSSSTPRTSSQPPRAVELDACDMPGGLWSDTVAGDDESLDWPAAVIEPSAAKLGGEILSLGSTARDPIAGSPYRSRRLRWGALPKSCNLSREVGSSVSKLHLSAELGCVGSSSSREDEEGAEAAFIAQISSEDGGARANVVDASALLEARAKFRKSVDRSVQDALAEVQRSVEASSSPSNKGDEIKGSRGRTGAEMKGPDGEFLGGLFRPAVSSSTHLSSKRQLENEGRISVAGGRERRTRQGLGKGTLFSHRSWVGPYVEKILSDFEQTHPIYCDFRHGPHIFVDPPNLPEEDSTLSRTYKAEKDILAKRTFEQSLPDDTLKYLEEVRAQVKSNEGMRSKQM